MRGKIKIGDVFELNTSKGKAYLHYIYNDSDTGELIRVLPSLYQERPSDFRDIVLSKERYLISFPVSFLYKKNMIEMVGFNLVSTSYNKPKFMRTEHRIREEFLGWHIIDTETWKRQLVHELSFEQKQLSPWGIWNMALLVERLENDWDLNQW